jgi:hypothetical protein
LTPYYSDHHYTETLRYTSSHFTKLHFTTLVYASLPLVYPSLPFHLALRIYISCRSTRHITSHDFTSHHITRHTTDLILKTFSKKVNSFIALKKLLTISLHFTFYFILFIYLFTHPINPTLHFTFLFLNTTYFLSPHFTSLFTFYRLYFPSLVYTFLTLVSKICVLPWEVPKRTFR